LPAASPALNYLGQLRLYSYADLMLLVAALGGTPREFLGITLLWFGFIVYLEWRHRDVGRLHWPWIVWVALWIGGIAAVASPLVAPFLFLAVLYAQKKQLGRWGATSWLVNGALKAVLAGMVLGTAVALSALVGVLTAVRNLAGDVRDVEKDAGEGFWTLPVLVGYQGHRDPYPGVLFLTSAAWTVVGALPWWSLLVTVAIEVVTYPLTPR
jgi:hypothetical protein